MGNKAVFKVMSEGDAERVQPGSLKLCLKLQLSSSWQNKLLSEKMLHVSLKGIRNRSPRYK